jgi:hypothetical protein
VLFFSYTHDEGAMMSSYELTDQQVEYLRNMVDDLQPKLERNLAHTPRLSEHVGMCDSLRTSLSQPNYTSSWHLMWFIALVFLGLCGVAAAYLAH